jgi:hypothetical protein
MFKQKLFFVGILKVNYEKSRIQDPDLNPDPLVRGIDPRIRIHSKMSWIRNTDFHTRPTSVADLGCLSRTRILGSKKRRILDPQHCGPLTLQKYDKKVIPLKKTAQKYKNNTYISSYQ